MPVTTRSKSTIKLDFSKMFKKPVSTPFVIAKSTEQQLAEALGEIEKFRETINRLVDTHNAQNDEIDALKKKNEEEMRVSAELKMLNVDVRRELYLAGEREARANAENERLKYQLSRYSNPHSRYVGIDFSS